MAGYTANAQMMAADKTCKTNNTSMMMQNNGMMQGGM